jgi:putative tricarboxylic transport membrane protein
VFFSWDYLLQGFSVALSPYNIFWALVGSLLGTLIGVLPGIGPTSGIAILLPLTTVLDPIPAIIMMAAIYYGAMYGGSTTAIVVNIPGESASVPTALDGYELAKQGRAGPALGIAAISSFFVTPSCASVLTKGRKLVGTELARLSVSMRSTVVV